MAVEVDEGVRAEIVPAEPRSSKVEVKGSDIEASGIDSNTGVTSPSCSIRLTDSGGGSDIDDGTGEDDCSRDGDDEGRPADVDSRILFFDTAESSMSGA